MVSKMKKILICIPNSLTALNSAFEDKENWLKSFIFADNPNLNDLKEISELKILTNANTSDEYDDAILKAEDFNMSLIGTSLEKGLYSEFFANKFGNKTLEIADSNKVVADYFSSEEYCNFGIAIFRNTNTSFKKYTALIVTQSIKDHANTTLSCLSFGNQYLSCGVKNTTDAIENRNKLISGLSKKNTSIFSPDLMLDVIYDDEQQMTKSEKLLSALDVLFRQGYGKDSRKVFQRYDSESIGLEYIYSETNKSLKIQGKMHYLCFGNKVTYLFDLSDPPQPNEKVKFKKVSIEVEKINRNAIEISKEYLMQFADNVFTPVSNYY
jgi:hypothetical protein